MAAIGGLVIITLLLSPPSQIEQEANSANQEEDLCITAQLEEMERWQARQLRRITRTVRCERDSDHWSSEARASLLARLRVPTIEARLRVARLGFARRLRTAPAGALAVLFGTLEVAGREVAAGVRWYAMERLYPNGIQALAAARKCARESIGVVTCASRADVLVPVVESDAAHVHGHQGLRAQGY